MKQAAKFLLVVGVLMMLVGHCFGEPPADVRARVALALNQAPYTLKRQQTCPCTGQSTCTCDPLRCACQQCSTESVWRQDGAGNWYRHLSASELQAWRAQAYQQQFFQQQFFQPQMYQPQAFGGACAGGS